jgi:hypothetical protein
MKQIRITTKSPEQIDAEFEASFKDLTPAAYVKVLTDADRLAPYRKAIMRQRKRGMSWRQIAEVMSRPPIDEKVSDVLLKKVFAPATVSPKPAPAPRPDDRYVLDPLTGLQVPPSALPR